MRTAETIPGPSARGPASMGRIGPNAVVRLAEALTEVDASGVARGQVFEAAGLAHYLLAPPTEMVDERDVVALHAALGQVLDERTAAAVAWRAGELTGDYLLAHRIPRAARRLLAVLPAPLASRALLSAIHRNAWTFAGSGGFSASPGHPVRLVITNSPLCKHAHERHPPCLYYAATFLCLFQALVSPRARLARAACRHHADGACTTEISW